MACRSKSCSSPAHELIGPEALKLGFTKPLVMTSGLRGTDIVHKIVESLKYHGLDPVLYDKVESNPKDYNVIDAVAMYQQSTCDSFVSIGGGSSHDACKGARVSVAHDGRNVNEFEGFNKSENMKNPPHIAVSTTAGTGSEASWAYVITDTTTDPDNPHRPGRGAVEAAPGPTGSCTPASPTVPGRPAPRPTRLAELSEGWLRWGAAPDAWFVILHGEVLCRA